MKTFYVQYLATASFAIKVQAKDEAAAREAADEKFAEVAPGGLCYQCARDWDLGDAEQDDRDGGVWEA